MLYLLINDFYKFNSILYTPDGKELMEKVWQDTIDGLAFADVRGMVNTIKA